MAIQMPLREQRSQDSRKHEARFLGWHQNRMGHVLAQRQVNMSIRIHAAVFLFLAAFASPAFGQAPVPGIYSTANDDTAPAIFLTVPAGSGPMVLTTSFFRENAVWLSYGEYEGSAKPAGKNAWTVVWTKKKATAGNFPLPATTNLTFAAGSYTLRLPGKQVHLTPRSQADLAILGMYNLPPFAGKDVMFASGDRESFLYVKRLPEGNVQFLSFTRKNPVFVPLKAVNWQVRLTRFLSEDQAPRNGTGALITLTEPNGASLNIQVDGERSPESEATLSLTRDGKPPVEYQGMDPNYFWIRKGMPSETAFVLGDFVLWKNAKNPNGVWLQIERLEEDKETWTPFDGGPALTWTSSSPDDTEPAEGTLTLPDKTTVHFILRRDP